MKGARPILVTGLPRSGTSMTCGALAACGARFGPTIGANPSNPRGFYEHRGIRDQILKPILKAAKADPLGQDRLPMEHMIPECFDMGSRLVDTLHRAGADAYKDAKIALLWPLFVEQLADACWVIVRRDRASVIDSCERSTVMHKRADWGDWHDLYIQRLWSLTGHVDHVEIWPDANDPDSFREAVGYCGLTFDREAVAGALMPSAWHPVEECTDGA